MKIPGSKRPSGLFSVLTLLQLIVAAGLVIDARIHLRLASGFDVIKSDLVSQGDLFRIEAVLAILAAIAVLVSRKPVVALAAASVALGGLVPLLVYRYYDIGAVGPLPAMYEPLWYPDKTNTAYAQAVAGVAALVLLVIVVLKARKARTVS